MIVFSFAKDTPRHMILSGDKDEGISELELIHGKSFSRWIKARINYEITSGSLNKGIDNTFVSLLSKKFLLVTILLSLIYFLCSLIIYGPTLIFQDTLSKLQKIEIVQNPTKIIYIGMLGALISGIGTIIGGFIVELKFLGRINSIIISSFLSIAVSILALIFTQYFGFIFNLNFMLIGMYFTIITTYSAEVYPTIIRERALGVLFVCTRVGGIISQIIYPALGNIYLFAPYYLNLVFVALLLILVFFLPYDTYQMQLDQDYQNNKKYDEDELLNNEESQKLNTN